MMVTWNNSYIPFLLMFLLYRNMINQRLSKTVLSYYLKIFISMITRKFLIELYTFVKLLNIFLEINQSIVCLHLSIRVKTSLYCKILYINTWQR